MAMVTVQDLLAAGVHFGHQTRKWNPKMKPFIYGAKNGVHIIDITKTMRQIYEAINFLQKVVSDGGNILFVGTKRQAQEAVKEAAAKTAMFSVTERWLGGTLTNNATIQKSIKKMKEQDEIAASPEKASSLKKKELALMARANQKLHKNLDGIANLKGLPSALVVVDVRHENIAIKEAVKLGIPIVAIVDTNGNIDNINYPIVANDDAVKSVKIITDVMAEAIKDASEIYKRFVEETAQTDKDSEPSSDESQKERTRKRPTHKKRPPMIHKKDSPNQKFSTQAAPAKKDYKPRKPMAVKKVDSDKPEEKLSTAPDDKK
jgi:small subunit ribosomal protein S2